MRPPMTMTISRPAACALLLAALGACDPNSCQGAVDTPLNQRRVDKPDVVRKCEGQNVEVIGDINVSSQRQLDEVQGCKRVRGAVIIQNSTDIVDLSALEELEEIDDGYFLAFHNTALKSVDLPSLKIVDKGIGVIDNAKVTAVTFAKLGTQDLEGSTFGDITIRSNPELTNVQFQNVQKIRTDAEGGPGSLILGDNPRLATLQGFALLETIEGVLLIFNEDALPNLTGLEQLNEVLNSGNAAQAVALGIDFDQNFNIIEAGNDGLTTLQGLNNLETINGDVFIGFNNALQDLDGLDDLAQLDHNLFIVGNGALENLSGLEGDNDGDGEDDGLSVLNGNLFVGLFFDRFKQPVAAGNDSLEDLSGLNSLTTLTGSLVLAFNQQLSNLDGLDLLTTVGKDLVIVGSRQLDDFQGAEALTTITGSLVFGQLFSNSDRIIVRGNEDAVVETELDEMGDVNGVPVTDTGCSIDLEADFTTGFPALTTIGADLVVAFSDFNNLALAQTLSSVGGKLILHGDAQPSDLTGLEAVGSFGGLSVGLAVDKKGNLIPSGNNAFDSFLGLSVSELGAGGLSIGFNDQLDNLATLPTLNNVAGTVTVATTDVQTLDDLNIVSIDGDLLIGAIRNGDDPPIDAQLDNLDALNLGELTDVGGDVLVAFNDQLESVAMPALGSVAGALELTALNALQDINGLGNLTSVGDLLIHDLDALEQLNLPGLLNTVRDVHITNNENLTALNLNSLASVGGTLELRNLPVDNLNTLAQLTSVGDLGSATGDLSLVDLVDLNDTTGLSALTSVGGSLVLVRAESLENSTLTALAQVGGSVELLGLERIEDLEGLETLQAVGDTLHIEDNVNLTTLKGLEGLITIGRVLSLVNNPELDIVVRDEDVQDQIDDVGGVIDQGLVFLAQVGDPDFEGVGGDRGVIEAKNNPKVREEDLVTVAEDFGAQYDGFFLFCGNQDSGENPDVPSDVQCP